MNYFDALTTVFENFEDKASFYDVNKVYELAKPLSNNTQFDIDLIEAYLRLNQTFNVYQVLNQRGLIQGVIYYLLNTPKFSNEERHLLSTALLGICLVYDRDAEDKLAEYFNKIARDLYLQELARKKFENDLLAALADLFEETRIDDEFNFISEIQFVNLILESYKVEVIPVYETKIRMVVDGIDIDLSRFISPDKKSLVYVTDGFKNDTKLYLPVSEYLSFCIVNTKGSIDAFDLEDCYFKVASFVCDSGDISVNTNAEIVSINTETSNIRCIGNYREKKLSTISGTIKEE